MDMSATILAIDPVTPDEATLQRAVETLRADGLVAFPTETVYGLGANALSEAAVRRIFVAKGRPTYNPLIVHVPETAAVGVVVRTWPESAARAAAAFWPGPLTLVLPRSAVIPDVVTGGLDTVGVRVPSHPVAVALLQAACLPLAAPSANRFTRVSPTTAAHVARGLGDAVDLILDGGVTPIGIESTVLDLSGDRPRLLRHGAVSRTELEAVLGVVEDATTPEPDLAAGSLPSPGMLDRHYAPAGEVVLFDDAADAARRAAAATAAGRRAGALLLDVSLPSLHEVIAMPRDARGYARLLYASMHALDDAGCDLVLVQAVPDLPEWSAIRDRLRRAGGRLP
jgi:L-threonylcarbamoyladenylate synthase